MEITKIFSELGGEEKLYSISLDETEMILFSEFQKVFSNIEEESEKLYSIILSEDEVALFSEFQKEYSKKPTWTVKEESQWTTNAHFTEPMKKHYKMSRIGKDMVAGLTGMATGGLLASAKSKKGSDALIGGILGAAGGVGLAKAHRKLTGKDKKAEELINSGSKEYNKLNEKQVKRYREGKSNDWNLLDKMSDLKDKTKKDLDEL